MIELRTITKDNLDFDAKEIYVGVSAENTGAKHLYSSIGFMATGNIESNAEEMKFTVI